MEVVKQSAQLNAVCQALAKELVYYISGLDSSVTNSTTMESEMTEAVTRFCCGLVQMKFNRAGRQTDPNAFTVLTRAGSTAHVMLALKLSFTNGGGDQKNLSL